MRGGREGGENESVGWGVGALWWTLKGGLSDVYMFILQVSRSPCALTGSRLNAFIRASQGGPWENTLRQHRETPHCQARSSPRKGAGREQIPTLAEPPTLGLGSGHTLRARPCPKKEKVSQICCLFEGNVLRSPIVRKYELMFFTRPPPPPQRWGISCSYHIRC